MMGAADLDVRAGFLDITTGELLPATVENAGRVLDGCRTMKRRIDDLVAEATGFLASEATRQGTKTLRDGSLTVKLAGGISEEYDPADLMEALRAADCPEERIEQAVRAEISYRVDRAVLRQLAAANPDYKAAIELARREVERPWRASIT